MGEDVMRVYFAGPMRGMPGFNYPAFHAVEAAWLALHPQDVTLNPASNFDGRTDLPVETYLQAAFEQLLSAQFIVLLPGWEQSEGARHEAAIARLTGKQFYLAEPYVPGPGWDFMHVEPPHSVLITQPPAPDPRTLNESREAMGLEPLDLAGWADYLADQAAQPEIRTFDTGASRDTDADKLDYEGFLSPGVLRRFAEYMHANRKMKDGSVRSSDNWQKGMPKDAYMKSLFRHFMEAWSWHRTALETPLSDGDGSVLAFEDALCGVMFNAMGYLHEIQKGRPW